ncbi:MAG: hypothetical protein JSW05_00315 [Candidatus Thorarchaeota archaeon]|nr:MAG: hypothetical protein JSW05_00315 [Candidatus Thorarchaeota archaeon]
MVGPECPSEDDAVYTESIKAGKSVRAFVSSIYLVLLALSVAFAIQDAQFILMSAVIIVSVTFVFVILYLNFRVLRITITQNHLKVTYGRLNRKIVPLERMTDCEHIQIRLKEYGGIGIRLGRDGTWAYNTSLGDAVRVGISGERPFAFSTAHPKDVCELLQELKA